MLTLPPECGTAPRRFTRTAAGEGCDDNAYRHAEKNLRSNEMKRRTILLVDELFLWLFLLHGPLLPLHQNRLPAS